MKDRTAKMSSNIINQQVDDLKVISALSIAVDESCDLNDTAQVSLFVRFMSATGPKEELLGLLPLKGQTRGEDIANAVIGCIEKYHIPLDKNRLNCNRQGKKYDWIKKWICCYYERKN